MNENVEEITLEVEDVVEVPISNDYEDMKNKPLINEVELVGNKSLEDLGIEPLTNMEIMKLINSIGKE